MASFLFTGSVQSPATILFAHGAGAPMDSVWMNTFAEMLANEGLRCVRFEFAYMAARREGHRKPPPRAETLREEYLAAVDALGATSRLLVGGKSMGGRVASLVAQELHDAGRVAGLVCVGYPFHPPGQPDRLRTAHLADLTVPALICQGERDPFGVQSEVAGYSLSGSVRTEWLPDGDHDLKPRKPMLLQDNLSHTATVIGAFAKSVI